MGARFGAFYHTKYSESHDDMAQIILSSKINGMDTSNEIQNHSFYFWGQLLSSLFEKALVAVCESGGTGSARGWKWDAKRRRIQHEMGVSVASFSTKNKDICYKQMSLYASNICVMVANAVSNCYKRRCSGSLRCSSLIML